MNGSRRRIRGMAACVAVLALSGAWLPAPALAHSNIEGPVWATQFGPRPGVGSDSPVLLETPGSLQQTPVRYYTERLPEPGTLSLLLLGGATLLRRRRR